MLIVVTYLRVNFRENVCILPISFQPLNPDYADTADCKKDAISKSLKEFVMFVFQLPFKQAHFFR